MILDMVRDDPRIEPERVCIDHVEEHTIRLALDAGHWVGMTLYPITKCTPARAADMVEMYGAERIMVNSAGDWGHSDPLAVPEFIFEMRSRGHDEATIRKVVYDNPLAFFSGCHRFRFTPAHRPPPPDRPVRSGDPPQPLAGDAQGSDPRRTTSPRSHPRCAPEHHAGGPAGPCAGESASELGCCKKTTWPREASSN